MIVKRAKNKTNKRKQEYHKQTFYGSAVCKNMEYLSLVLNNSKNLMVIRPLIIIEQQIFSDSVSANSTSFWT